MERVLRLVDLEDQDGDSDNNEGEEGKGSTTTTPPMAKNRTRKDKKKLETNKAAKKNNNKKKKNTPPLGLVVVSDHRPERLLRYFECDDVGSDNFTSFECRVYTAPKHRWQDNGRGASEERVGKTKANMMSLTLMGATSFTFVLGIPAGPVIWRTGRRQSTGGRRGWALVPYRNSPGIERQKQR